MVLEDNIVLSNGSPSPESVTLVNTQNNELNDVTDGLESLNFVDRNITDLKRELSSFDNNDILDNSPNLQDDDLNKLEKTLLNLDLEETEKEQKDFKDNKEVNGFTTKQVSSHEPHYDHIAFGLEGIFDAMKCYYHEKSPFLPTGRLDTESLKQKLLQETPEPQRSLDEDSIFYDRCLFNTSYGKTINFKSTSFPKLSLETYFYVFYNVPRDNAQNMAANELFKRQWKYHEPNKLWFKQDQKKSLWVYFDPGSWTMRSLNLTPEVENLLMSKADIDKLMEKQEQNNQT